MLRFAAAPPLLPRRMWPQTTLENIVDDVVVPLLNAVMDRIDVTQLILDHVSIPRILDAVDVDGVVARVDVSPVVARVLSDVDLPEIVRSSSDSLFSDAVLGLRLESASGDDIVDRFVGRLLRRGRGSARIAGKPSMP